jgi:hypothetical protein
MQRSNDETASERTPGAADEAPQECVGGCGFFGRVRTTSSNKQPRAITLAVSTRGHLTPRHQGRRAARADAAAAAAGACPGARECSCGYAPSARSPHAVVCPQPETQGMCSKCFKDVAGKTPSAEAAAPPAPEPAPAIAAPVRAPASV